MSETTAEATDTADGGWDGNDSGWGAPGAEVEAYAPGEVDGQDVIDAVIEGDDDADQGELPELEGETDPDDGWQSNAVEPWAVSNSHDYGAHSQQQAPKQRQGEHDGARPGGGSGGGGGGGLTGKMTRRERKRRQREANGGGGGGGVHVSLFGGVLTNASVVKTGAVLSNNGAGNSAGLVNGAGKGTRKGSKAMRSRGHR